MTLKVAAGQAVTGVSTGAQVMTPAAREAAAAAAPVNVAVAQFPTFDHHGVAPGVYPALFKIREADQT